MMIVRYVDIYIHLNCLMFVQFATKQVATLSTIRGVSVGNHDPDMGKVQV
jgi:hypothetical protein